MRRGNRAVPAFVSSLPARPSPPPGRPGSCLPGLPQIRTCPTKASGSSRQGFTIRLAIRGGCVDPRAGERCPRWVAPPQVPDEHPPSLPRVPAVQVPLLHRYYGDVRLPAPLSPRFVVLRLAIPCAAPVFSLPAVQDAQPRAWGSSSGPHTGSLHMETIRASQVPGEPSCAYALALDPGRTGATGPTNVAGAASVRVKTKAPTIRGFRGSIPRPWHSLSTLRPRVAPSDARLAFRCWPALRDGIGYRRVPTEGFRDAIYIASSFPRLCLAQHPRRQTRLGGSH